MYVPGIYTTLHTFVVHLKSPLVGISIFQVVVGECRDSVSHQPVADGNRATTITGGMIGGRDSNWVDTDDTRTV